MSVSVMSSEQQLSRSVLTEALEKSAAIFEVQRKLQEDEGLRADLQKRELKLDSLHKCMEELHKDQEEAQQLHLTFDTFLKDEDAAKTVAKAERESNEVVKKSGQIQRLQEDEVELTHGKHKLRHQLQKHTLYQHIMEQVVKMTKFKDAELLADHLESQLHLREQLCQREREAQEQVDQKRKEAATLDDQHDLMLLQKNNRLSQLQTRLEETRSEALTWERKWNHIQETAAKKTLLLGQIKMATLNLYEMTSDTLEAEEGDNVNDTEKQLCKIKMFIQDHKDIVQQTQRVTDKKQRQKVPSTPHKET